MKNSDNPLNYSLYTRLKARYVFKHLKPKNGEKLLDVGCGLGYFMNAFSSSRISLYGIEPEEKSIRFSKEASSGNFVQARAEELPFKDSSFENILCLDVLEHVEGDSQALMEIHRVGKDHATVVVIAPALDGILSDLMIKDFAHSDPNGGEYHFRRGYTLNDLLKIMESRGITPTRKNYCMVFFSKLVWEMTKVAYALFSKKAFREQADVRGINSSFVFGLYKICFPALYLFSVFEDAFLSRLLKGHILIVNGTVTKKT